MATKTFVKGDKTRRIDSRDTAGIVRAEYAGWVAQADAPAEKPAPTSKSSDTKS